MAEPAVFINVTEAKAGARECIDLDACDLVQNLNPGQARRLASQLVEAAELVDGLCPPLELPAPEEHF